MDPTPEAPDPARSRGQGNAGTLVLGVLGGIASGKSEAARLLAGSSGLVLSADRLAHEILATEAVSRLVRETFGPGVLDAEGRPDRAALARLVFDGPSGEEHRRTLEGWIHPRVRARILERLSAARAADVPRVVLDVPLLLENDAQHGFVRLCDALIFVEVDEEERERRARIERGWAPGDLARRESAQLTLEEKKRRADHVLPNNGTLNELEAFVQILRAKLASD